MIQGLLTQGMRAAGFANTLDAVQSLGAEVGDAFQHTSPVTDALSGSTMASPARRLLRRASRATELASRPMVWAADQLHQARLRLEAPDILTIDSEGVNIGMGIRIRAVNPNELGEVSSPYYDHVRLLEIIGKRSGLHAFIGVHSLMEINGRLWCIGGTRMRGDYPSRDDAIRDVLRLSRAMTHKCAAANIPIGGGKCDITYDPRSHNKAAVLRDFAKALEYLKLIFTGQDMNISPEDAYLMASIAQHSIIGPSIAMGGIPPTPPTARGVFFAIREAASLHNLQVEGLTVALQGLGGVGSNLVPMLIEAGMQVTATDISDAAVESVREKYGDAVRIVEPERIYDASAKVFSPSAQEDVIGGDTIPRLVQSGTTFIAGAANNPLVKDEETAIALMEARIRYYGDYVVNGGGLIGVASGVMGYNPDDKLADISVAIGRLHTLMTEESLNGYAAAHQLTLERMADWRRLTSKGWVGR